MKKYHLQDFTRGWLVGDFEPSIIRTKNFEFMVRSYTASEQEEKHVHKIADEITAIISGKFKINGEIIKTGDVIHLSPGDPADFECIEDGSTAVIKTPSVMEDKYSV